MRLLHGLLMLSFVTVPGLALQAPKPAQTCDASLWDHVWSPKRLIVLAQCKTVTGRIVKRSANEDGDEHMLLNLDPGQEDLLRKKNRSAKAGNLVIEAVCAKPISQKSARPACRGFRNQIPLPHVGDRVQVTGSYVLDTHNGWAEIHPITSVVIIQ